MFLEARVFGVRMVFGVTASLIYMPHRGTQEVFKTRECIASTRQTDYIEPFHDIRTKAVRQLSSQTATFLDALESFSKKKLTYTEEVGLLVDLARTSNRREVFEDIIFHAKFLTKSFEIMNRIGKDGEGYDKLAVEFETGVEKTTTLMKTLVKDAHDDVKQHFVRKFFGINQRSFGELLKLCSDLAWVKNWQVDGHHLPLSDSA